MIGIVWFVGLKDCNLERKIGFGGSVLRISLLHVATNRMTALLYCMGMKIMLDQLKNLQLHLVLYRQAVDQMLSPALTTSKSWRDYFAELLVCTAQLYLDYLLIAKSMPEVKLLVTTSSDKGVISTDSVREMRLRAEFRRKLESPNSWPGFTPQNPFGGITGYSTLENYVDAFALHLPEIYEETFRVEACTKIFLKAYSNTALAELFVSLQHLGRNHASFVLQPLEWAADEENWDEPLLPNMH